MTTLIADAIQNETQDEDFAESMPIVPVILRSSDTEVITYAMLDSCSTGTFVLEDIRRELKLDGVDSQVLIKTMNGQQLHNVKVLKGLTVSDLDGNNSIVLPKAFTKTEMPATDQDIPTPELARKWPHLTRIADRMHPFIPNAKIGFLIDTNCPKAIEPKDFVTSMNGGPFAVQTFAGLKLNKGSNKLKDITKYRFPSERMMSLCLTTEPKPNKGRIGLRKSLPRIIIYTASTLNL